MNTSKFGIPFFCVTIFFIAVILSNLPSSQLLLPSRFIDDQVGNDDDNDNDNSTNNITVTSFLQNVYNHKRPSDEFLEGSGIEDYCGSSPDFQSFFSMVQEENRSRYDEDKIIYEKFFTNNVNIQGTYIELGAFDGKRESNTHFFNACLKWKGLLMEGNPEKYEQLVANRPNAHRMNFAPSCPHWNETVTFYDTIWTNAGIQGHAQAYDNKSVHNVTVPCGPLGPVIEHGFGFGGKEPDLLPRVNFFSLDVEGAEKLVLDTIDFSRVQIDILMIEIENTFCAAETDCEVRKQVRKKMADAGYEKHEGIVRASDVYIHPNFENNPFKNNTTATATTTTSRNMRKRR